MSWCSPIMFLPMKPTGLNLVTDTLTDQFTPFSPPKMYSTQSTPGLQTLQRSTCHLVSAYHQIPLAEQGQYLTTFLLPWGRFFYTRTPMGMAPDFAYCMTDHALREEEDTLKSVDDALCKDKGLGPQALTATVEEVLKAFRKHEIIASIKNLVMGHSVECGDAVVQGSQEGVTLIRNMYGINAIRNMRRPRTKKEGQVYLGTVCSLLKQFPDLNTST